jgi:hypothetical protein
MDGDSEMRSSPEESETDPFPSTNAANNHDPVTPTDNTLSPIDKLKMAELSPPTSQDPPGLDGLAEPQLPFTLSGLDDIKPKEMKMDEPGASWKNKKAQEDFQRAWSDVVDKDFSLSRSMQVRL